MEENNEVNEQKKGQLSKFVIVTILIFIWVFGIGSLTAGVIKDAEDNKKTIKPGLCMSTSEIEGFNSTFTSYEGKQTGSNVKALMIRLVANANTYKEEPSKIPCISYNAYTSEKNFKDKNYLNDKYAYGVVNEGETTDYVEYINKLIKGLDLKHTYKVVMKLNKDGYIAGITINYDENDNSSNFVVAENNDKNIINGLKGIPELVDGEIKISSGYSGETENKVGISNTNSLSENNSGSNENKNNSNTIIVVSSDSIEE